MATTERVTVGPRPATIALFAAPVVLLVILWLVLSGGGSPSGPLPALTDQGLAWAVASAKDAGFARIEAHDALGRDRHWRNDRDWKVCFQDPKPGSTKHRTMVQLGAVKVTETCPAQDQARYDAATDTMPNLRDRTAYLATQFLGKNASIRFVNLADRSEVHHGLGDWRVCTQTPLQGEHFDGVPVTLGVVPFEQNC